MLNREAILGTYLKLKVERVEMPAWGGEVYVREWTGAERDALEAQMLDPTTESVHLFNVLNRRAAIAALSICNESGARLFTDADVPLLGSLSAEALDVIVKAALTLNGMTGSAVDDAEKNSDETTPGEDGSVLRG